MEASNKSDRRRNRRRKNKDGECSHSRTPHEVDLLRAENAKLREQLIRLSDICDKQRQQPASMTMQMKVQHQEMIDQLHSMRAGRETRANTAADTLDGMDTTPVSETKQGGGRRQRMSDEGSDINEERKDAAEEWPNKVQRTEKETPEAEPFARSDEKQAKATTKIPPIVYPKF